MRSLKDKREILKIFCEGVKLFFDPKYINNLIEVNTTDIKSIEFFSSLNLGLDTEFREICFEWYFSPTARRAYSEQELAIKHNMSIGCYQDTKRSIEKHMFYQLKACKYIK
jgi:hypothetical protein